MTSRILKAAALVALTITALAGASCGGGDSGEWRILAPMPTPRTGVAVVEFDDKIYVAGGVEADGRASNKVEVYDPQSNTWSETTPLPEPRNQVGAAPWGYGFVVVGGFREADDDPTATVFQYDARSESWSEKPALETARGAAAITNFHGSPVAAGGVGVNADGDIAVLESVEMMDAMAETWTLRVPPLKVPRRNAVAASALLASGDELYNQLHVIGGRSGQNALEFTNESHRISTTPWSTMAPVPTARSGAAAAFLLGVGLGRRIYVFGGEGNEGVLSTVEAYDAEENSWASMKPLPTARHGHGAVPVRDTIYVIGGSTPNNAVTGANEAFTP